MILLIDAIRCRSTSRPTGNRRMFTIGIYPWVWLCPRRHTVHFLLRQRRRRQRRQQLHHNRHLRHDCRSIIKSPTAIVTTITANLISYISSNPLTVSHRRLTRRPFPPRARRPSAAIPSQSRRHHRRPTPGSPTRNFNSRRISTAMENPISSTSSSHRPITALIPSNSSFRPPSSLSLSLSDVPRCLFFIL